MTMTKQDADATRALTALEDADASVRLRAAMAIGTAPDPGSSARSSSGARSSPTSRCASC